MQIQGKCRCINCFKEIDNIDQTCSCGYCRTSYKEFSHCLLPGTILDNRYYVGRVIGEGGFGITYVGFDENLDLKIAIKEFFLSGINSRNTTISNDIEAGAGERENIFETYRDKFINEAKILAKFNDEEGVVSILNFFKSNNTAYIIMEYLDGETLKEYLKRKTRMCVNETLEVFLPLMKTLDRVHTTKLIHRDISPDNIFFTKGGKVKLLDFGAAREVVDGNKSLSVVLKHGYAPPEQYQSHGNQGPWTDIYALSATIYKCMTGKTPTEAMDRMLGQELEPVYIATSDCPQNISDVIMKGLEIQSSNRYQSMGEMAEALKTASKFSDVDKPTVIEKENDDSDKIFDVTLRKNEKVYEFPQEEVINDLDALSKENANTVVEPLLMNTIVKEKSSKKTHVWPIVTVVICAILACMLLLFLLVKNGINENNTDIKEPFESGSVASGRMIKVGIINNDPNESGYRTANDNDLKNTFCEANGYDASFAYSLKNDEQIAAAQKFVQDGVDYLLLSAADTAGWDSVLKDAQTAGVKVILFDRTIDADPSLYEALIVSDMSKEGDTAVTWLAGQNLSEYNVIHIQGVMGSAAQLGRSGALDAKAAAEANWNIVTQQTAEWNAKKAEQIVTSVINAGDSFNVIYAENDDMAKGAVAALDKAGISHGVGKDVIVMGFDCNKWALKELLAQRWNYDGQCNPFQASYVDDIIKNFEAGKAPAEKLVIIDEKGFDASTITQDDVNNYGL